MPESKPKQFLRSLSGGVKDNISTAATDDAAAATEVEAPSPLPVLQTPIIVVRSDSLPAPAPVPAPASAPTVEATPAVSLYNEISAQPATVAEVGDSDA